MAERDDNFLSRWSRRKVAVKEGVPVAPEAPVIAPTTPVRAELVEAGSPCLGRADRAMRMRFCCENTRVRNLHAG